MFSNAKPEQFCKHPSLAMVINNVDMTFQGVSADLAILAQQIWRTLDEEIHLQECDIYSYIPDLDSDPFGEDGGMYGNATV